VVSSPKKRKVAELEAQELGAHINGTVQTIGGSPERLVKLVQATLFLLSRPHLSKKLTQIVAGRWIHVFQFRRPAMSFLESTWEFIAKKGLNLHLVNRVRRELFNCMCSVPFLHTFLGASVAGVTTASDASNSGGAVGIAKSLTAAGQDYVTTLANFPRPRRVPVLVISLFNGIGGALRAYDLLSVVPVGAVVFEIHPPANRVTMKRWPYAEICGDVRSLDEVMIRNWLDKYIPLREVHLWAGFPCNDLSSVRAGRQGLQGPGSGLFWEVVRIKRLLEKELPPHVALKYVGENVASMDKEHCEEISSELEVRPYHLNPSGAVPMQRPRLCWTSEELEGAVEGITFEEKTYWTEITATAPYPTMDQWVTEGCEWPGGEEGHLLPTAMKSIKRKRPPESPAGLNRCDWDTIYRWTSDDFRFPPYHYQQRFIFWRGNNWRLCNASEKDLLLGYGWEHTKLCYNASTIKGNPQQHEDERLSLLGDSFSVFSFVIPAAALCRAYIPKLHYHQLALRMGLAPGFTCPLNLVAPLGRKLQYGSADNLSTQTVEQINKVLLARVNHTGSDIRLTTGEVLSPKSAPRQSVQAGWWDWKPLFKVKWKLSEHINVLELRSSLLAAKYHILHLQQVHCRIVHITDSFVCMSVISKGRTGSKQLGRVLKELNAWMLGFGITMIVGHVESSENPTDGESRSMALQWQADSR
jgi:site-specific DNA-cytosine methylase